jgi:hypothetical protein
VSHDDSTGNGSDRTNDEFIEGLRMSHTDILLMLACDTTSEGAEGHGRGSACLDESALARLVGDDGTYATHIEIAHLVGCAHCRSELASLAALLSDPGIAGEIRTLETQPIVRRHRAPRFLLGALAAAAVVLLFARPVAVRWFSASDAEVHRGPTIDASGAPRLVSPAGDVEAAPIFVWTGVAESDRYRLTLYDGAGHVVYEAQLRDTTLALPASVALARGVPYVWRVDARMGLDRWTSSESAEFFVGARRTP